jgi:hypothetical protein
MNIISISELSVSGLLEITRNLMLVKLEDAYYLVSMVDIREQLYLRCLMSKTTNPCYLIRWKTDTEKLKTLFFYGTVNAANFLNVKRSVLDDYINGETLINPFSKINKGYYIHVVKASPVISLQTKIDYNEFNLLVKEIEYKVKIEA